MKRAESNDERECHALCMDFSVMPPADRPYVLPCRWLAGCPPQLTRLSMLARQTNSSVPTGSSTLSGSCTCPRSRISSAHRLSNVMLAPPIVSAVPALRLLDPCVICRRSGYFPRTATTPPQRTHQPPQAPADPLRQSAAPSRSILTRLSAKLQATARSAALRHRPEA